MNNQDLNVIGWENEEFDKVSIFPLNYPNKDVDINSLNPFVWLLENHILPQKAFKQEYQEVNTKTIDRLFSHPNLNRSFVQISEKDKIYWNRCYLFLSKYYNFNFIV